MPKVKFNIDYEKEVQYLALLEKLTPPDRSYVCLPSDLRSSIIDEGYSLKKEEIIKLINIEWDNLTFSGNTRRKEFENRERLWREVEKSYFTFIEEITETKWKFDEYTCLGSVFSYVNYYSMAMGKNEVLITIDDAHNPNVKIAHELFHSHQINLFDELKVSEWFLNQSDNFIEVSLILVFTDLDSPFELDRASLLQSRKTYLSEDLSGDLDEILDLWNNRNSFKDFILEYYKKHK